MQRCSASSSTPCTQHSLCSECSASQGQWRRWRHVLPPHLAAVLCCTTLYCIVLRGGQPRYTDSSFTCSGAAGGRPRRTAYCTARRRGWGDVLRTGEGYVLYSTWHLALVLGMGDLALGVPPVPPLAIAGGGGLGVLASGVPALGGLRVVCTRPWGPFRGPAIYACSISKGSHRAHLPMGWLDGGPPPIPLILAVGLQQEGSLCAACFTQ